MPHAHRGLWKIVFPLHHMEKEKKEKGKVHYRSSGTRGLVRRKRRRRIEGMGFVQWSLNWFSIQECLCLPSQTLPAGELQQVASSWRGPEVCQRPEDQNVSVSQLLKKQITLEGNGAILERERHRVRKKKKYIHV